MVANYFENSLATVLMGIARSFINRFLEVTKPEMLTETIDSRIIAITIAHEILRIPHDQLQSVPKRITKLIGHHVGLYRLPDGLKPHSLAESLH
ncbi:hypothetical protein D3C84_988490 [compost metagenome]